MNRLLTTPGLLVLLVSGLLAFGANAAASEVVTPTITSPVAVRYWGQGIVSIETWWDMTVVVDPRGMRTGDDALKTAVDLTAADLTAADLALVTHMHTTQHTEKALPRVMAGLEVDVQAPHRWGVLDRPANTKSPTWRQGLAGEPLPENLSPHAIKVETIVVQQSGQTQENNPPGVLFFVEANGVRIAHLGTDWPLEITEKQRHALGDIDVLCVPEIHNQLSDPKQVTEMIEQIHPRFVLLMREKSGDKHDLDGPATKVRDALLEQYPSVIVPDSNTFAITTSEVQKTYPIRCLQLSNKPTQHREALASLLKKMDESCRKSQKVFAPLTANQMNWRPPNGTHTPRWNTEHMLGRQLGFFSQIYAAVDHQSFREIDLNPKQMPADYQPAHPDWDGAEQARQMQRANAYVQRFAYLLNDIDLDARAPGSRWTLRGLLKQMDRHFAEHTANVQRKFKLEEWPEK